MLNLSDSGKPIGAFTFIPTHAVVYCGEKSEEDFTPYPIATFNTRDAYLFCAKISEENPDHLFRVVEID